jgi:hypothetical protein
MVGFACFSYFPAHAFRTRRKKPSPDPRSGISLFLFLSAWGVLCDSLWGQERVGPQHPVALHRSVRTQLLPSLKVSEFSFCEIGTGCVAQAGQNRPILLPQRLSAGIIGVTTRLDLAVRFLIFLLICLVVSISGVALAMCDSGPTASRTEPPACCTWCSGQGTGTDE